MTKEEFERIQAYDKRCGENEGTMFGTTIDRRRLIEYVKELEAERDEWRKQAGIGVQSQFDEGVKYEKRIAELEAENARLLTIVREIAENEDCQYASCGIACAEYLALAQGTKTPEVTK